MPKRCRPSSRFDRRTHIKHRRRNWLVDSVLWNLLRTSNASEQKVRIRLPWLWNRLTSSANTPCALLTWFGQAGISNVSYVSKLLICWTWILIPPVLLCGTASKATILVLYQPSNSARVEQTFLLHSQTQTRLYRYNLVSWHCAYWLDPNE